MYWRHVGILFAGLGAWRALPAQAATSEASSANVRASCATALSSSPECPARAVSRVLVIGTKPELESALRTALSAWGVDVRRLKSRPAQLALSGDTQRRAELARELKADALIWIDRTPRGAVLGLYDATRDTTRTRLMPRGRLNAASSAALALSIKTELLSASADEPAAEVKVLPLVTAPAPNIEVAPRPEPNPSSTALRAPGAGVALVTGAALRRGALSNQQTEVRYDAEVRWAPGWLRGDDATSLWLAARVDLGAATAVTTPAFRGEYAELGVGLAVGVSHRLGALVEIGAELAASLDHASLDGTLLSDAARASESRFGTSVRMRPEMGFLLGPLALLLQPALGAAASVQRYRADGAVVLETGRFSWGVGAGLRLNAL